MPIIQEIVVKYLERKLWECYPIRSLLLVRVRNLFQSTLWLFMLTLLVVGCDQGVPGLAPTENPIPTPTITATPTAIPTATITPLPPIGLLLIPSDADPHMAGEVQASLSLWIPDMGYRYQIRPSLSESDLERDDFRLVVVLPPYPEIASLSANHPEIKFLSIGIQGLEPAPNLTTIGADGNRLDHQGFIAGYMAAMITPDWRVGVIGSSESIDAITARQAFFTGVKFYCGLCLPAYPPFYEYPLYFELGAEADTAAWLTAADYMIHRSVATVYVVPGAGDDAMFRQLSDSGVNIIGEGLILPELREHWVASLSFSLLDSFRGTWQQFVKGGSTQGVTTPLQITDINPELLSPGKQRLIEATMEDMLAGYIDLGLEVNGDP